MATPPWMNPGLVLQIGTLIVGMGVSYGVMTNKMDSINLAHVEFRAEVMTELKEMRGRNESSSITRAQVESLKDRVNSLERFQSEQNAYNLKFLTAIARLERE